MLRPLTPHHLAIKVRELGRCERFYRDVLGLTVVTRHEDHHKELRSVWLACGDLILMLERSHDDTPHVSSAPGLHLFAFAITPVERNAWKEVLLAAGVRVTHETPYSLFFQDPEGNRLALSHYPDAR